MSDRLKKLKNFGIAVSYIALLSTTNSFAASAELSQAQSEQFDIFDVESEQLNKIDSSESSSDDIPIPSFSGFEDNNEIVDDLFVDSLNDSGDIVIPEEWQKKSASSNDGNKEITNETKDKTNEKEQKQVSGESDTNIMLDDKDYVFNKDESDSLEIQEEEEFKKLLLESVDSDDNIDNLEEPAIDEIAKEIEESSAVDDLFSKMPSIEGTNEMGMEAPNSLDSIENEMESFMMGDEDTSIEIDASAEVTSPAIVDTSPINTSRAFSENDPEYKNLRTHLDNFLLSFAGEEALSESKTSKIPNIGAISEEGNYASSANEGDINVNDITPFNPEQMFENENEMNIDENIAIAEIGMNESLDNENPDINGIPNEDTAINGDDNIENIDDIDVEVAIDNNEIGNIDTNKIPDIDETYNFDALFSDNEIDIEEYKEEESRKVAEAKKAEDERLKKELEEKERKEKQARIIGSCDGLPEKISACEPFECQMPDPSGSSETVKISIDPDSELCNYKTTIKNKPNFVCGLNDSETLILSSMTDKYFESVGNNKFDVQNEFPEQCMSTKMAINKKIQEQQAEQQQKAEPKKLELSTEDKAYFKILDQKRASLPKDKQLPDSVIETIKEVAPSIADKPKDFKKKPELKNINIARETGGVDPYEDTDVIKSNSGMDITLSKKSSVTSEIKLKMEQAYRALLAGQISAAVVLYNQVLEHDKENMDALFGLATAYHKNYQYEQARSTYAKILRIEPGNKEVLNNFLVLVAEESPESALIELQKLERINSNFSPIPAQIAMIYLKLGQPETAERYLRRAVILSPENITYKYNLAITSDKLNKHYQAINLYKQVLEAAKKGAVIPGSISSISSRMDYLEGKISSMN